MATSLSLPDRHHPLDRTLSSQLSSHSTSITPRQQIYIYNVWTRQRWQGALYMHDTCFVVDHMSLVALQGLGKGGAKRHRKILRDNIQGITKPVCFSPPYSLLCAVLTAHKIARLFVALPAVEVSNVFPASSTKRPVVSSRFSWRTYVLPAHLAALYTHLTFVI